MKSKSNYFFNISNHASAGWSKEQTNAALQMADTIIDVRFPNVPATATSAEVQAMAAEIAAQIPEGSVAMVQGEMTLVFSLCKMLQEKDVTVLAACSNREVEETVNPDGSTSKKAVFRFVQFREYL